MTEEEQRWIVAANVEQGLASIQGNATDRKLRLFAVACCRRLWNLLTTEESRHAVEVAERLADGLATNAERRAAALARPDNAPGRWQFAAAQCAVGVPAFHAAERGSEHARALVAHGIPWDASGIPSVAWNEAVATEGTYQLSLLRDIFGNPFRPVTFAPEWRTEAAVGIAAMMYDARDFGNMPVLADALQDAGCEHADILAHCREPGTHVRGCWVVDLVLGKE